MGEGMANPTQVLSPPQAPPISITSFRGSEKKWYTQFFYKQQGLSNESLDCKNIKQRESRFETKLAKLSNKKIISKQENEKNMKKM